MSKFFSALKRAKALFALLTTTVPSRECRWHGDFPHVARVRFCTSTASSFLLFIWASWVSCRVASFPVALIAGPLHIISRSLPPFSKPTTSAVAALNTRKNYHHEHHHEDHPAHRGSCCDFASCGGDPARWSLLDTGFFAHNEDVRVLFVDVWRGLRVSRVHCCASPVVLLTNSPSAC